jgi:hypothetical protein
MQSEAWLGYAWGDHLYYFSVVARLFFSPKFIRGGILRAEYGETIEAAFPTHK